MSTSDPPSKIPLAYVTYRAMIDGGTIKIIDTYCDEAGNIRGYHDRVWLPAGDIEAAREQLEMMIAALDKPLLPENFGMPSSESVREVKSGE